MKILMTTTQGITIPWEEMLEFHARRARLYSQGSRLQNFHKTQGKIILLKLTQSGNNAWTWASAIREAKNMMKEKFYAVIISDSQGGHMGIVKKNKSPYAVHMTHRYANKDNCKAALEIWLSDNTNVPLSKVKFETRSA